MAQDVKKCGQGQILVCFTLFLAITASLLGVCVTGFFHLDKKITGIYSTLLDIKVNTLQKLIEKGG